MKAALLIEPGKIEIGDVPVPSPGRGEVLVRIREAGICGSDYAKFTGQLGGPYGIIPGHEAAGEIAALGPGVQGHEPGDRVVIQPNIACGECEICRRGRENICPRKVRLGIDVHGAFAQYVTLPARYVWNLPANLSFSEGALAEPLAVALHGFNKSPSFSGERVLVYGAGVIGLFFIRLAALAGARVTALDPAAPRLAVAARLGAERTLGSLQELEGEAGTFAVAYETSGTAEALSHIIRLCEPGARIILTGLPKEGTTVLASQIVRKELLIQGAMIYKNEFSGALDLLAKRAIGAEHFISAINPLEKLGKALADFPSPNRVKDLILIP
ncbi:MAG: alcohol dehydrogenase catalytic domain-containing protein [Smithellaceae bacterium]|nr:alcohol dehydrogenase catalytic domain-containing protein [Smithellaceae bacterium]